MSAIDTILQTALRLSTSDRTNLTKELVRSLEGSPAPSTTLPENQRRQQLQELLSSWLEETNEDEQRVDGAAMRESLDENRTSSRQLFPPELKGVSW